MPDLREVELRIAVAEGVLSRAEAEALGEEARRKKQSPLALLVERGNLTEDSYRSLCAEAMNDPAWRATTQDASASTYTMTTVPRPADEPPFPVAAWDRYANVKFLGQGGMGKVFLAVDTNLRREVAIKFVRGDDAEHVRRLISEARTQALVSHERICKVYEVGEVEGKVYIAMQYIKGQSLGAMAGELTLEQKVMQVRGAAEGIHEAHRVGVIHRDIKPSNIMVERSDDGEIRPYVMDFGLARSAQEAGATLTGTVLGTPHYMSPEQAHGAAAKLDRRADVYSLGATLYRLVTGEPPVPGETVAEVIHNLITLEPRPLRAIDPNIPIDLEAIVLKCLEKERSARYDSARALVEDLDRFLNGEPVLARPAGAWYRLRKRIAKHRRLVAAGAVAVVLLGAAVGWGIKTSGEAAERERLARRFTEMVGGIEADARYSALSPLHDIRGDRATLRAQMDELDAEIQRAGAIAEGPGHYALGRGYLALEDDDRALTQLQAAWDGGFREPRVAYQLAIVMGHLYQQGLLAAERIDDKELREAKKREVEKQYRAPAFVYLFASQGAEVPSPEYFAALEAYYQGQLDDALKHIDAIGGGRPWFYEAFELRGDILLARALTLRRTETERARRDFEAGRRAYAGAATIARSLPGVYKSLGDLEYAAMVLELYGKGEVMPAFQRAIAATARALTTLPDHYDALVLQARIRRSVAEHRASHGGGVEDLLEKALADAKRAMEVSSTRPQARLELAQIYRQWGDFRQGRHDDPSEQFAKAVAISETIPPLYRDGSYYGDRGLIFSLWADYQDQVGADSQVNRGKTNTAYTRALQINAQLSGVWGNLGINWYKQASQPRAKDPDGDVRQALIALEKSRSINPVRFVSYLYKGKVYELMAQRERARGLDPDPDLKRAMDAYQEGLTINDKIPHLHNGFGLAMMDQAKVMWDRGGDPDPLLDQAAVSFRLAVAAAPEQGYGYGNLGEMFAQRAWFQRARGDDPSASVAAAIDQLNQAITWIQNETVFWADLGMAYAVLAGYELEHDRDPQPSCALASEAIDNALKNSPNDVQSQLYRGETLGIVARFQARQGKGNAADFAAAEQAYLRALELDPDNPDAQIALGHFYRASAAAQRNTGDDPGSLTSLSRGLALAKQVLARRPTWPDALVLRGGLLLVQAQGLRGAGERRAQATAARQDFEEVLARNPVLGKAWTSHLALAQKLAAVP